MRYALTHLVVLFVLLSTASAEDYVYVLPDGRVQWNPNVRAKKVSLSDLPEAQQQVLLRQRQNAPTMGKLLHDFSAKFQPVTTDAPATCVRVLLACDTDAQGGISAGVAVDLKRINLFLSDAFRQRPGACEIKEISGSSLTADAIVAYYRQLRSTATETLVFYYSGHGGVSPLGHVLTLSDGTILYRSQLLTAMQQCPHQCLIVLTDCCSNTTTIDDVELKKHRDQAKQLLGDELPIEMPAGVDPRTVEWLFLRHVGTIDLTAAAPTRDQFSWSTDATGGFFTYSLVRVLRTDVNIINKGQRKQVDNQVTWQMAFTRAQSGAALLSLGRRDAPSVQTLMNTPAKDRDRIWQFAHAFSFH